MDMDSTLAFFSLFIIILFFLIQKICFSYTSTARHLCAPLKLEKVIWSAKLIPNEFLLKFKKNVDYDGFIGDMSDKTQISIEIYQVKVVLKPGNMIFEASIKYLQSEKKFVVSVWL